MTGPQRLPRLPYPELRRFIGAASDTNTEIAAILGLSRHVVLNYQRDGIPLWSADVLACRIGVHPVSIWGERWWEANDEYDDARQARAVVAA